MADRFHVRRCLLAGLAAALFLPGAAQPQQQVLRMAPRGEPVAETRLLMQGMDMPNLHALELLLRKKTMDADDWTFGRGQALLIAESGNLLLLRPPRGQGRDAWFAHALELRETATRLARTIAARDLPGAHANLTAVTDVCNRCHQTFRVKVRLEPGASEARPPVP